MTSNPASCLRAYEALARAIEFRLLGSDEKKRVEFQRHLDTLSKTTFLEEVDGCSVNNEAKDLKKMADRLKKWDPTGDAVPELKRNQGYPAGSIVKPAGWKPDDSLYWTEQGGTTGSSNPSPPMTPGSTFADGSVTWTLIDWSKSMRVLQRSAETYTGIAEAFKTSLTQADVLVNKAPDAAKLAGQLEALAQREKRVIPNPDTLCPPASGCPGPVWQLSTGVLSLLDGETRLRWDKIQKRPLTIKASAPFAEEIARRHKAEVMTEYQIRHRFFADFSIGLGVTYTEIADPTFKAVTNPLNAEEKVIARTSEDTRAGELALLLHYPLQPSKRDGFFRFGFEAGAGLDADKPSFFLGTAYSFGKYVHLGVGWTWQEVTVLADDQKELTSFTSAELDPSSLTIVSGDEDIRTRGRFDNDYYISLTFNIRSLPFFKSGSE